MPASSGDWFEMRLPAAAFPAAQEGLQVFHAHSAMHFFRPRPGQYLGGLQGRLPTAGLAYRDEIPVSPGVIAQAKRHYWKSSS